MRPDGSCLTNIFHFPNVNIIPCVSYKAKTAATRPARPAAGAPIWKALLAEDFLVAEAEALPAVVVPADPELPEPEPVAVAAPVA